MTMEKIMGTTFAECPNHLGEHLYMRGVLAGTYWQCRYGCDPLADADVYVEHNERHSAGNDGLGPCLMITEYETSDYDED